jgi:hypothetical protein
MRVTYRTDHCTIVYGLPTWLTPQKEKADSVIVESPLINFAHVSWSTGLAKSTAGKEGC